MSALERNTSGWGGDPSNGSRHPLGIGETVAVVRLSDAWPPFIEGRATIRRTSEAPHCYWVQFPGDPVLRERVVHPDYQQDPVRWLAILNDLREPEINGQRFPDFFPYEPPASGGDK